MNNLPVIVYDDYNNVLYIFNDGLVYDSQYDKKIPSDSEKYVKTDNKVAINLRFSFATTDKIPEDIETIYFKDHPNQTNRIRHFEQPEEQMDEKKND